MNEKRAGPEKGAQGTDRGRGRQRQLMADARGQGSSSAGPRGPVGCCPRSSPGFAHRSGRLMETAGGCDPERTVLGEGRGCISCKGTVWDVQTFWEAAGAEQRRWNGGKIGEKRGERGSTDEDGDFTGRERHPGEAGGLEGAGPWGLPPPKADMTRATTPHLRRRWEAGLCRFCPVVLFLMNKCVQNVFFSKSIIYSSSKKEIIKSGKSSHFCCSLKKLWF